MRSILSAALVMLALLPTAAAATNVSADASADGAALATCSPMDFDHELCIGSSPTCLVYRQSDIHGRECYLVGHLAA